MSRVLPSLVSLYTIIGLGFGMLMHAAIPALNVWGMGYIAITWPQQAVCARLPTICDAGPPAAIAPYLFTFNP